MTNFEGSKSQRMEWATKHDTLLLREILVCEPYKFKKSSNERGRIWTLIANNLNKIDEVYFRVKQRGVRERFEGIQEKYLQKTRAEEKASGISPDETEVDQLMEEITEKIKIADAARESEDKTKKSEKEQEAAVDIRKKAMETFGATKKRSVEGEGSEKKEKRHRRSGSSAVDFLREKTASEMKLREEELALQKERQQQKAVKQQQQQQQEMQRQLQQQNVLDAMKEQQTQVQNISFMMMQQQQQQTVAMMAILDKLLDKNK